MKFLAVALILAYLGLSDAYTKYGRTCKDIGCPSNEVCVMENDPCSYYQRQGECGSYPTCKRNGNSQRTCSTYVCPPTKVCKMDGDTPKCVDDHSKVGHVGYNTQNQNTVQHSDSGNSQPSAPSSGNLYPQIPRGETTPRPNLNYNPSNQGGGYQGGSVGSGYPGQTGQGGQRPAYPGYPQQQGGYPQQQGGYPQQQGGYAQGGYRQQGGYPQGYYPQGYYQQGYPQGYYPQNYPQGGNQGQGGYQPYPGYGGYQQGGYQQQGNGNRNGQKSSGSSFSDQITDSLKSIGSNALKNALGKLFSGNGK